MHAPFCAAAVALRGSSAPQALSSLLRERRGDHAPKAPLLAQGGSPRTVHPVASQWHLLAWARTGVTSLPEGK